MSAKKEPVTKDPEQMTEAELAEYYYDHRDEPDGEELPSRKPERMDVMISARFSLSEASEVRSAAEKAKMSVSAFLRQCALGALSTNVIDLERVRADLEEVQSRATDALRAFPGKGRTRFRDPRSQAKAQ